MKTLKNKDQSNTELIKQQKLKAEYKNNKQLEKQAEIQMEKHKRTANMKLEVIRKASASIDLDLNTPTNRNPTLASLNTPWNLNIDGLSPVSIDRPRLLDCSRRQTRHSVMPLIPKADGSGPADTDNDNSMLYSKVLAYDDHIVGIRARRSKLEVLDDGE